MIGKLTGTIDSFGQGHVVLDVQGVGYLVFASARTLGRIGQKGDRAGLLIDTHVREDHIHLYGFADAAEQQWFRLLTSVQGVGAKVAMSILASASPERLAVAIAAQDKAVIQAADGVGPKLAVRILTELKDKAEKINGPLSLYPSPPHMGEREGDPGFKPGEQGEGVAFQNDAVSALINLGYARSDAYTAVMRAQSKANDNLQDLIRLALKELSA